jgi:hypothetical protein
LARRQFGTAQITAAKLDAGVQRTTRNDGVRGLPIDAD